MANNGRQCHRFRLDGRPVAWVVDESDLGYRWRSLLQQLKRLGTKVQRETCHISARPPQARNESALDRGPGRPEHNGNRRCCPLRRQGRGCAGSHDHVWAQLDEFRSKRRQPRWFLSIAELDSEIPALNIAAFAHSLTERRCVNRPRGEEPYPIDLPRLLGFSERRSEEAASQAAEEGPSIHVKPS